MVVLVPQESLLRSPSLEHGLQEAVEERLRLFGAELVQRAGPLLRLPQVTLISAASIFQRFYFRKSFADFEVRAAAAGALALACKLEETPRKLRDVLVVLHRLAARVLREEGGEPSFTKRPTPYLDPASREYADFKHEVVRTERHILRELGFEVALFLDHPHRYVLRYVAALTGAAEGPSALAQQAWNYLNDSFRTALCCRYQPDQLAAASIFLAARSLGVKLPSSPPWWEALGAEVEVLKRIAETILRLYRKPPAEHVAVPQRNKERKETPGALPAASPLDSDCEDEEEETAAPPGLFEPRGAAPDAAGAAACAAAAAGAGGGASGSAAGAAPAPERQEPGAGASDAGRLQEMLEEAPAASRSEPRGRAAEPPRGGGVSAASGSGGAAPAPGRGGGEDEAARRRKEKVPEKDRDQGRDIKVKDKPPGAGAPRANLARLEERERERDRDRRQPRERRSRSRSRSRGGRKQKDKGKDRRPRRSASTTTSRSRSRSRRSRSARSARSTRSRSAARRRARRRNPARHGFDEADL